MSQRHPNKLYRKCRTRKLRFNAVCEVGVYLPELSNVYDFILDGVAARLVEPDPESLKKIRQTFSGRPVTVIPKAVYDYTGTLEMVQRNASTFVKNLPSSPALCNDLYTINKCDMFTAECVVFNEIDDGSIDLLSVDTEGCEWYVIKNLRSRPAVICLETHGKFYTNPFLKEIVRWMKENGYSVWYKTKCDTVYGRNGAFPITLSEKLSAMAMTVYVALRKARRIFGPARTPKRGSNVV